MGLFTGICNAARYRFICRIYQVKASSIQPNQYQNISLIVYVPACDGQPDELQRHHC